MKTFRTLNYKKFNIITILLTAFLMTFTTCQKGSEIIETDRESNESPLEKKLSDIVEDTNDLTKTEGEFLPSVFKLMPSELPSDNIIDYSNKTLLYEYEDIYIPFTNPSLPNTTWYKYNPLIKKWYSFKPNDDEEHEIKELIDSRI